MKRMEWNFTWDVKSKKLKEMEPQLPQLFSMMELNSLLTSYSLELELFQPQNSCKDPALNLINQEASSATRSFKRQWRMFTQQVMSPHIHTGWLADVWELNITWPLWTKVLTLPSTCWASWFHSVMSPSTGLVTTTRLSSTSGMLMSTMRCSCREISWTTSLLPTISRMVRFSLLLANKTRPQSWHSWKQCIKTRCHQPMISNLEKRLLKVSDQSWSKTRVRADAEERTAATRRILLNEWFTNNLLIQMWNHFRSFSGLSQCFACFISFNTSLYRLLPSSRLTSVV